LSQANVRRLKAGLSIEEWAESIARRGLIPSLHVRAVRDVEGKETGMFEVPAGGRCYRALEMLVKQKRLDDFAWMSRGLLLSDIKTRPDCYTYWFKHYVRVFGDAIFDGRKCA
jgi:hypothetical protein